MALRREEGSILALAAAGVKDMCMLGDTSDGLKASNERSGLGSPEASSASVSNVVATSADARRGHSCSAGQCEGKSSVRIAIDGAQSTGKTTLQAKLIEGFGSVLRPVPEAARIVAREVGLHSSADWATLLQDKARLESFFLKQEAWQADAEAQAGSCVVDGSRGLMTAYRRVFLGGASPAIPRYDLVLYCGLDIPFCDDGFRFSEGRERVDELYRNFVAPKIVVSPDRFVTLPAGPDRWSLATAAVRVVVEAGG
jgi:nicotinamide riboside kinase